MVDADSAHPDVAWHLITGVAGVGLTAYPLTAPTMGFLNVVTLAHDPKKLDL